MDDIYLFDDSESVLAKDFIRIQQLLGAFGLNINPSKTAYDEAVADVTSAVTQIQKDLMQVVEIENYVDTPSGVEVVSEFVEVEGALNETQVEALLGFLRSDSLEESDADRSEEHTSELQSLMRISYAVFCLQKKTKQNKSNTTVTI